LLIAELACKRLRSSEWHWRRTQVLVWVETTKSNDICKTCELNHWSRLHWAEVSWTNRLSHHHRISIKIMFSKILLVDSVVLEFLWHWWESDSFWKIWKRINEISLFEIGMEERATITKLAFSSLDPVSAWLGFVIGVYST
jgi:hypothetical protein